MLLYNPYLISQKGKRRFLENYFENIGDIMAENGKVTTLLPAPVGVV